MPVLRGVPTSARFIADPSGIFRRYGRARLKAIMKGLGSIETFGGEGGESAPGAALVYAEGVIPRMIQRTVFDGVAPAESVREAAAEIREALASTPD